MLDSRVTIREGNSPILIIAPHGANDKNTDYIAEYMAERFDCYSVINWGWEKSTKVDCFTDQADCNNLEHCHEDVVYDEFLSPILRYKARILQNHRKCFQFIIHGVGNDIKKKAKDPTIDLLVGYGASSEPQTHTCPIWFKDLFIYLAESAGMQTYLATTDYAGKRKRNLNQIWKRWYPDGNVYSLQVEIVQSARRSKDEAQIYAEFLGEVISKLPAIKKEKAKEIVPPDFTIREV
jgi:hypothetical protein